MKRIKLELTEDQWRKVASLVQDELVRVTYRYNSTNYGIPEKPSEVKKRKDEVAFVARLQTSIHGIQR